MGSILKIGEPSLGKRSIIDIDRKGNIYMKEKYSLPVSSICFVIIGLVPLLMPYAPFIYRGSDYKSYTTGFELIFGGSNIAYLLAWVLVLVGVVTAVMSFVPYSVGNEKTAGSFLLASGIAILLGSIAYFLFPVLALASETGSSYSYHLASGGYLGGAIGLIDGILGIYMGSRSL